MENKLDSFLGKVVVVTMDTQVQNKGLFLSHDNNQVRLKVNSIKKEPIIFALDIDHVASVATLK